MLSMIGDAARPAAPRNVRDSATIALSAATRAEQRHGHSGCARSIAF